jgi:tetratricopeptide (TPR) repeat protein
MLYAQTKQPENKEQALIHLEKAARQKSALPGQLHFARTVAALGDSKRAASVYWEILEKSKGVPLGKMDNMVVQDTLDALLADARSAKNREQVAALCRRKLEQDPFDPSAFVELGETLHRMGRDGEVLDLCQEWIERNPFDPLPRNVASKILLAGHARRAVNQLEAMLRIQTHRQATVGGPWSLPSPALGADLRDPRPEELWYRLGQTVEVLGGTSQALTCYQNSWTVAPNSRTSWQAKQAYDSLRARKGLGPKK